ncbi:DUF7383 domain-containing protein [Halosegnis marinus]|uniref:Carbohydrate binding module (Family 6) n=1 Tax=Halosegnis marinus TaxID=3034023 RepID=A0ABD5ZP24_9EURY|nr:hypothetical protein [Halosegnis sp. DT85]
MSRRTVHALVEFGELLGPHEEALDVPWAEFAGDRSSEVVFEVGTDDAADAYLQIQAYDVGTYDHEVLLNGEPLSGFDLPPADGWQSWTDAVTGAELREGENTLRVRRDEESRDAFVVGSVVVNWTEPV